MRHLLIILLLLPMAALSQELVAPVTNWVATVDSATQQIMLRWNPSADSTTLGYHICTGNPCLDYDTVFGRFDTNYICLDHSSLEQHTYRLHVFDSTYNVSKLTPAFGNVVLEAEVPDCETAVSTRWTPYEGIPEWPSHPTIHYILWERLEPFDTAFVSHFSANHGTPMEHTFSIPESTTRVWLRVEVLREEDDFHAFSNIVMVERRTSDTASVVAINNITYDSIHTAIDLTFEVDTAFEYTLYRSIDGSPWQLVESFHPNQSPYHYHVIDINPHDSLHCYQLSARDACGINPKFSPTKCVSIPSPPPPSVYFPTAIILGDPANGTFLPMIQGLQGTLYELHIYNRMGILVYHTTNPTLGWTPHPDTPQGVYTYRLRCQFNDNNIKTHLGTVLLIK